MVDLLGQVQRDISKINERGLGSLDDLSLLTNLLFCEWRLTERNKNENTEYSTKRTEAVEEPKSNKKLDRDINGLYINYLTEREIYTKSPDHQHNIKLISALKELTAECYDLIYLIKTNAILAEERDVIDDFSMKIENI